MTKNVEQTGIHPLVLASVIISISILLCFIAAFFTDYAVALALLSIPLFFIGIILGAFAIGRKTIPLTQRLLAILGPFLPGLMAVVYFLVNDNLQ